MTYSTSLSLSRQRFGSRNQNIASYLKVDKRLGPIASTVLLIVLACLLGMLYLTQVTHTNALSYQINGLQDKQQTLKNEQEELQVTAARLQALDNIKNSEAAKSLVSVSPTAVLQN